MLKQDITDEKSKISIIIPVYQVERFLPQCLDSIFSQNTSGIQVIAVDDGSRDNSGKILDEYALKYSNLSVIHQENSGVAAARNNGFRVAGGKWVYFMDSDDWLVQDSLEAMLENSEKDADCDVILMDGLQEYERGTKSWEHFSTERIFTEREEMCALQCGTLYFPFLFNWKKVTGGSKDRLGSTGQEGFSKESTIAIASGSPIAAPWDKLYRRTFLEENNLRFSENLKVLDDMVFNFEVFGKAKKVSYRKNKIYHYRYVEGSITNQYKADRVKRDQKVWEYLEAFLEADTVILSERLNEAFYCRIIKSFAICCRLTFFHPDNKKSLKEQKQEVKRVLSSQPYKTAFANAPFDKLEWKLKAVVWCCKREFITGLHLLHKAEMFMRKK